MKIREYQVNAILARHGVPVPRGETLSDATDAAAIARRLGTKVVVVKAQIHAGGRGKGGGVKLAKSAEAAEQIARHMIGMTLVTHQTGPEGRVVARVLVEEGLQMTRELYVSLVLDRAAGKPVMMATAASLIEVNPLVVTASGDLLALDAKMNFDDSALYRHPDIRELRDLGEEDPLEIEASKFSLNYIHLDGTIGCMVNGAGLAMATMDIIKLAGGEPANFLDVGGGANAEQIRNAFKILMSDENVKAVLINIFGGILRCDVLAQGVIAAVKELGVPVPIVIRMEGTNVTEGKRMLKESGLNFTTADSMGEAAEEVVALAETTTRAR